jgi:hypothetical protein
MTITDLMRLLAPFDRSKATNCAFCVHAAVTFKTKTLSSDGIHDINLSGRPRGQVGDGSWRPHFPNHEVFVIEDEGKAFWREVRSSIITDRRHETQPLFTNHALHFFVDLSHCVSSLTDG